MSRFFSETFHHDDSDEKPWQWNVVISRRKRSGTRFICLFDSSLQPIIIYATMELSRSILNKNRFASFYPRMETSEILLGSRAPNETKWNEIKRLVSRYRYYSVELPQRFVDWSAIYETLNVEKAERRKINMMLIWQFQFSAFAHTHNLFCFHPIPAESLNVRFFRENKFEHALITKSIRLSSLGAGLREFKVIKL